MRRRAGQAFAHGGSCRAGERRVRPVHLDGARIFNAAIALETTAKEIASYADTVSFCLSKGLACPVGSVLCGSQDFIARRIGCARCWAAGCARRASLRRRASSR